MTDTQGYLLLGRYRLDASLGEGAFGEVRAGWDMRLDRPVAIKILHPGRAESPDAVRRFEREARITARLRSPHAVPIHDVGQTADGRLFMVMERIEGPTLRAALRRGPMALGRALAVADQICALLVEAHGAGLVHRDLKPENVMLDGAGEGRVRVLDFGVAKVADGAGPSTRGLVGTPAYIAPEIWAEEPVDGRTDLYAVGLILHELLAGAPAVAARTFHGAARAHLFEPLPGLHERVPPVAAPAAVQALIDALTARDPEARPVDAAAVRALIAPLQGLSAPPAPMVAPPPPEEDEAPGGTLAGPDSLDEPPRPTPDAPSAAERPARRWWGLAALVTLVVGVAGVRGLADGEASADAAPVAVSAGPAVVHTIGVTRPDAAPPDAAPPDAAPPDAAVDAAGQPDAAPADAGQPDAADIDATPPARDARRRLRPMASPGVALTTQPPGARVWLGSTLLGAAPLTVTVPEPLTVVVEAPEHYGQRVRLTPGQAPARVVLEPVVRLR